MSHTSTVWTGYLRVDDSGFIASVEAADAKLEGTKTKAKDTSETVKEEVNNAVHDIKKLGNMAMGVVSDMFDAMGISLGAMGSVVQSAIQVAIAVVGIATAETGSSMGALAFNLATASLALGMAVAAQGQNDAAKASLSGMRGIINMVRVVTI